MRKKYKAFSLVELLVSMAIIAVLLGLAVFGIGIAQRVLRDNQRRGKAQDIVAALNAYYVSNSGYPADIVIRANSISVGNIVIDLAGPTVAISGTESTTGGTVYCYIRGNDGYRVGVELEDGQPSWFTGLSTGTGGCSTPHAVVP